MWANYHQHSFFCDGKGDLESHVKEAIRQKVKILGFSSHMPVPFPSAWNMPLTRLAEYVREITRLQTAYASDIEIYKSLELDYVPNCVDQQIDYVSKAQLDYFLCSIHYVDNFSDGTPWEIDTLQQTFERGVREIFGNDVQKAVVRYYELMRQMLEESTPHILGHLDKIKIWSENGKRFDTMATWYREEVMQTLEVARAKKVIIEVNTRGWYKKLTNEPYPAKWILNEICAMNLPIMLNSDAHTPDEVIKFFPQTARLLKEIGFHRLTIFRNGCFMEVDFDENGMYF